MPNVWDNFKQQDQTPPPGIFSWEKQAGQALQQQPIRGVDAKVQDVLAKAGQKVEYVFSNYVNRPISTALLMSDKKSPLYDDGFQPSDIKKAWDRSEKITMAQAAFKVGMQSDNAITQLVGMGIQALGGPDFKNVNLWDDADVQKNFEENVIGRYMTGTADFLMGNFAGGAFVKGLSLISKQAKVAAGLNRVMKPGEAGLRELDNLAEQHFIHNESGGTAGVQSVFGQDMVNLANTDNITQITNTVRAYSNNENLPGLIQKTTDPRHVRDMILADRGDFTALERLASVAPADAWAVGDVSSYIAGHSIASGSVPSFEGDILQRVNAAFDDAIERGSEAHKRMYEAFLKRDISMGTDYRPIEPIVGKEAYIAARGKTQELRSAAKTRNFGSVSNELVGGGFGRPVTALIRFVGTQVPRGVVRFSGARAWDGVDEFRAAMDASPLLANGKNIVRVGRATEKGVFEVTEMTASDYINMWLTKYMDATDDFGRSKVLDEFDDTFGRDMARSYGVENMRAIDEFVSKARQEHAKLLGQIRVDGYGFDHTGTRLLVDPQTQRQLIESKVMLPWAEIEHGLRRELRGSKTLAEKVGKIQDITPTVIAERYLSSANAYMTASMLLRPAYIAKNSLAEPLVAAIMSQGSEFVTRNTRSMFKNSQYNMSQRLKSAAKRISTRSELKQVNQEIDNLTAAYDTAVAARDEAYLMHELLLQGKLSPATTAENAESIVDSLKRAESIVAQVEEALGARAKLYGVNLNDIKVPSAYELNRRIEFLEANGMGGATTANAKSYINRLSFTEAVDENLEKWFKEIDKSVKNLSPAIQKKYEILAERQAVRNRKYGGGVNLEHVIKGQKITIDDIFDPSRFGTALRNEAGNSSTQELQLFRSEVLGNKNRMLKSLTPGGVVDVGHPLYFEELAFLANRYVRGDKFQDLVLAGKTRQEMYEWAAKREGRDYISQFVTSPDADNLKGFVDNRYDFTYRYFPDDAIRKMVLEKEVTGADLGTMLANRLDELTPIHPHEIDYPVAVLSERRWKQTMDRGIAKAFQFLSKPENAIRWAWAQPEFQRHAARRLEILADQGIDISDDFILNGVRSAAARDTMKELQQTFYTIPRQNRALWMGRYFLSFPTAAASGIYRYGRLAIKNPQRATGFLRNYYGMYNTFGVDENGNRVDDPLKAKYIVLPGTKDWSAFGAKGVMLSTKSISFLVNLPGPSWLTALSVASLLQSKATTEDTVKHVIDSTVGKIPGMDYANLFPYGPSFGGPTWANKLWAYATSDESDRDYLISLKNANNYLMTQAEMGLIPKPTKNQVEAMAKNLYLAKALWAFASPLGMTPKIDKPGSIIGTSEPGSLFIAYGDALLNKYNGDKDAAEQEMLATMGANFPTDRYLYKGSTKQTFIEPTLEGYQTVWKKNPDLAKEIARFDPSMIGLLTLGVTDQQDDTIARFLSDPSTRLPDGTLLNPEPLNVQKYEDALQVNRDWRAYNKFKEETLAVAQQYDSTATRIQDVPVVKEAFDKAIAQWGSDPQHDLWYTQYRLSQTGDNAFKYSDILSRIVNNDKFWAQNSKNPVWQDVKLFLNFRKQALAIHDSAPTGMKNDVVNAWQKWVEQNIDSFSPQLKQLLLRYFSGDQLRN